MNTRTTLYSDEFVKLVKEDGAYYLINLHDDNVISCSIRTLEEDQKHLNAVGMAAWFNDHSMPYSVHDIDGVKGKIVLFKKHTLGMDLLTGDEIEEVGHIICNEFNLKHMLYGVYGDNAYYGFVIAMDKDICKQYTIVDSDSNLLYIDLTSTDGKVRYVNFFASTHEDRIKMMDMLHVGYDSYSTTGGHGGFTHVIVSD